MSSISQGFAVAMKHSAHALIYFAQGLTPFCTFMLNHVKYRKVQIIQTQKTTQLMSLTF